VKWVFVVHSLVDIFKNSNYESEIHQKLSENTLSAVIFSHESLLEMMYLIATRQYGGVWGDLKTFSARQMSYLASKNGQMAEAKEFFRIKKFTSRWFDFPNKCKLLGCNIPEFPIRKLFVDCGVEDLPF